MIGTGRPPFRVYSYDQITLDLPMPPSVNRIWRKRRWGMMRSEEYLTWMEEADVLVLSARAYPKHKIGGAYEMDLLLNVTHRGDGDNRIKAVGDWLESRDIVRNDVDCRKGSWEWVEPERAPLGCRVTIRALQEGEYVPWNAVDRRKKGAADKPVRPRANRAADGS
jgi:Holliday junction resolvase RusA-like endonuclease